MIFLPHFQNRIQSTPSTGPNDLRKTVQYIGIFVTTISLATRYLKKAMLLKILAELVYGLSNTCL